jgi:4,5-dihydroxyphthalate decarboxylase
MSPDPRTLPLIERKVTIDGYELAISHDFLSPGEQHHRFENMEFDVCEFSTATLLRSIEAKAAYIAVPVFFTRGARYRNVFYRQGKGRKIGLSRYGATANIWTRGLLLDAHFWRRQVGPNDGKVFRSQAFVGRTEEIIRYIRTKRIYPIMHIIAMKAQTAVRYADLAVKLTEAFREAKRLSPQDMSAEDLAGYEKEQAVLGEDPYAYLLGKTEIESLQALNRYQIEQGLMKQELDICSLFLPETLV